MYFALQAECEALRADSVKWEEDAKSLRSTKDVSALNLSYIYTTVVHSIYYSYAIYENLLMLLAPKLKLCRLLSDLQYCTYVGIEVATLYIICTLVHKLLTFGQRQSVYSAAIYTFLSLGGNNRYLNKTLRKRRHTTKISRYLYISNVLCISNSRFCLLIE